MQATYPEQTGNSRFSRKLAYFLAAPIAAFVVFSLLLAVGMTLYQSQHRGRVFSGVTVWNADLGGMTEAEAAAALTDAFPYWQQDTIILTEPQSGEQWQLSPAELGLDMDVAATVDTALGVGRTGLPLQRAGEMFRSYYYGRNLSPVLVLDENKLEARLDELAASINRPPVNAQLDYNGETAVYAPSQIGRQLDKANLRQQLLEPLTEMRPIQVELLVHDLLPAIQDSGPESASIQQVLNGPITFYLREPLQDVDLGQVQLPEDQLTRWLRVEVIGNGDGTMHHEVFLDENAARHWLRQYADQLYREPVNARFYYDDYTEELVLVAPHVNGRELDVDATIAKLKQQINNGNRTVPFILKEITPTVHSGATAAALGITELVSQRTTWFYGSSGARKHNIARSAANFYGIVVAPGEEFSFNKYLGSISEADGYEVGLIIAGGRTIEGVGGGVCQVSTTMFQTAFHAGFPITERWEHGYMVGYYSDGEGQGMDATVFSPVVDLKFINNTPYHLLIENYYNEENQSLTFKFYSTSMGRTVVKEEPQWSDVVPAPGREEDIWEFDEDLDEGEVEQFDWATEGATVSVRRLVYNADGDRINEQTFVSNYIPWPNGYKYGPGVEPFDYSQVPPDPHSE